MLFVLSAAYFCVFEFVLNWNFVWTRTMFSFMLGVVFSLHEKGVKSLVLRNRLLIYSGIAAFLTLAVIVRNIGEMHYPIMFASRGIVCLLGPCVALILYALPLPRQLFLTWLGRVSYELYLIHGIVIYVLGRHSSLRGVSFAVVVLAVSFIGSWALSLRRALLK